MTAYRFVTITCDGCGEVWDEGIFTSIPAARKVARQVNGWSRDADGEDFCRACTRRGA